VPSIDDDSGYTWRDELPTCAHGYIWPFLARLIDRLPLTGKDRRVFDLGCGNGATAHWLSERGWEVTGVDPSEEGIRTALRAWPELRLEQGSAYDDLAARFGRFPLVVSLDVVEHLYYPRKFAATLFSLVEEGGTAIVTAPYHGYLKNLALAVTGRMDRHFTALWDHGHIKFWSKKTLRVLLEEAGFSEIRMHRIGRIPPLAKSLFAVARRSR
jgi:2-polyprenyl-6-hydroxyphenyl methylase/3-demethylubiquinone-9 3-methyltransferase